MSTPAGPRSAALAPAAAAAGASTNIATSARYNARKNIVISGGTGSGIENEDIQSAAETFRGVLYEGRCLFFNAYVGLKGEVAAVVGLLKLLERVCGSLFVRPVDHPHSRACFREAQRYGSANAACAAGDEGVFAV